MTRAPLLLAALWVGAWDAAPVPSVLWMPLGHGVVVTVETSEIVSALRSHRPADWSRCGAVLRWSGQF